MDTEPINGALICKEFSPKEIRKTAMDLLDIARQLERESVKNQAMLDFTYRMRRMTVELFGMFPQEIPSIKEPDFQPPQFHSSLQEHTLNGC